MALIGYMVFKQEPAPAPVVENPEEVEEENEQTPVTPTPAAPSVRLDGKSFRLTYYNGMAISKNEDYTLSFQNGRISAKFCNDLSGAYSVTGSTIKGVNVMSTLKICTLPKYLQEMETLFSNILMTGGNVSLVGDILVVGNGQSTLTFAAVAQ